MPEAGSETQPADDLHSGFGAAHRSGFVRLETWRRFGQRRKFRRSLAHRFHQARGDSINSGGTEQRPVHRTLRRSVSYAVGSAIERPAANCLAQPELTYGSPGEIRR